MAKTLDCKTSVPAELRVRLSHWNGKGLWDLHVGRACVSHSISAFVSCDRHTWKFVCLLCNALHPHPNASFAGFVQTVSATWRRSELKKWEATMRNLRMLFEENRNKLLSQITVKNMWRQKPVRHKHNASFQRRLWDMTKTNYCKPIFLQDTLFYNKIAAITWAITLVTKLKIFIGEESDKQKA